MAATGTYAFDPRSGDLVINAFAKCGLGPTDLTTQHFKNAQFEANLLNVDITNRNPNGFAAESATKTLTTSDTYTLNGRVVSIAAAYITNDSDDKSRIITQISSTEYAAITDKTQTASGGPTVFAFSRLQTPTIAIWPLVSSSDTVTYTLNMLTFRQGQDFNLRYSYTTDLPYRYLDAFATGLASRLALIYAPDKFRLLDEQYEKKFILMSAQDQEDVPLTIAPDFSGYAS